VTSYVAYGFFLGNLSSLNTAHPQERIVRSLLGPRPEWVKYPDLAVDLVRERGLMVQPSFHKETTFYTLVLASTVISAQREPLNIRLRSPTVTGKENLEQARSELSFLLPPEPSWFLIPSDL